jgi:predicted short-subunit dehydrogenase-like oxidoreductase (DUF2520 family)
MILRISIIGTGNVASWFFHALHKISDQELQIQMVSGRDLSELWQDSELYIFSLKDDVYEEVLKNITFQMSFAVHTSGSLSIRIFEKYAHHFGVIYPYQTISMDFIDHATADVPLCIEADCGHSEIDLTLFSENLSTIIYPTDEQQRKALHLAAIFACNFSNAMFTIADQILQKNNLNWDVMIPLLEQTVEKVKIISPADAQTGPAKRGDIDLIQKHLHELEGTNLQEIYTIMSAYIIDQNKPLNKKK